MRKVLMTSVVLLFIAATAEGQAPIRCESANGKYHECRVSGVGRIVLNQQLSDTACVEGKTWGTRNGMVWVSGGCRGEFGLATNVTAGTTLLCESKNNIKHTCRAEVHSGVTLARQLSDNACVRGRTWGVNKEGVWVDKGCRAEFQIGDAGSLNQSANARIVRCESQNNGRTNCKTDTSYGVHLARQLSKNSCNLGSDWGYDHNGVWVDHGCRADFTVGGYTTGASVPMTSASYARPAVKCESRDGKRSYCRADTSFGVTMLRQTSDTTCVRGQTWGYDENGIWVNGGCRAEFLLDADH
ncbi:MAG TPA: DUF3011 domain-containing protein [Thermoanaerobaculia bacterium]|nr:DUF3011 domain-containing protein [Thermoanaerobaculia bacterium]